MNIDSQRSFFLRITLIAFLFFAISHPVSAKLKTPDDQQATVSHKITYSPTKKKFKYRTTIEWPSDCDFTAQEKNEYFYENLCAATIRKGNFPGWPNVSCDYNYSGPYLDSNLPLAFYPLAAGKFLVEFPCMRGAYNTTSLYAFYDETRKPAKLKLLKFIKYRFNSDKPVLVKTSLVNGRSFNKQTKELITLGKYRGMGDCGDFARYTFEYGKPILKEFRAKQECDGQAAYSPAHDDFSSPLEWPQYYPK